MARVLVLAFTDARGDPRVRRQVRALSDRHQVTLAAVGQAPALGERLFTSLTTETRPPAKRAAAALTLMSGDHERYYWRRRPVRAALRRLAGLQVDLIIANEAETWPVALALADKLHSRPKVLFDAHEFEPEVATDDWRWRLLYQRMNTWICRTTLPQADVLTTVSDGIADAYRDRFGVDADGIIPNAAPFFDASPTPVGEHLVRLVHHGRALPSRNLETLIDTMGLLDDRFRLDLVLAPGPSSVFLQRLKHRAAGDPRIGFPPPVPLSAIPRFLNERYDVGVHLLPPTSLNNTRALPNKLFEFLQARLAIAIGPSPEMVKITAPFDCRVVADDFTADALAAVLRPLDAGRISSLKAGSHRAAEALSEERFVVRLRALVDELVG